MPFFLLRDGSVLRCSTPPDDLQYTRYVDRQQREILVLLDRASEHRLLAAQLRHSPRRPARNRQRRKTDDLQAA